jgi:GNAT superfamily N-acetyltransferase
MPFRPEAIPLVDGGVVRLRTAEVADAPAIVALAVAIAREGSSYAEPDEIEVSERLADRIAAVAPIPIGLHLVAERDGVVGWAELRGGSRRRLAHTAQLTMMVRPGWRRLGIGGALLAALIDWARRHPALSQLSLWVLENNHAAIELYRRHHFVEVGRAPRDLRLPSGDHIDSLLMSRSVNDGD